MKANQGRSRHEKQLNTNATTFMPSGKQQYSPNQLKLPEAIQYLGISALMGISHAILTWVMVGSLPQRYMFLPSLYHLLIPTSRFIFTFADVKDPENQKKSAGKNPRFLHQLFFAFLALILSFMVSFVSMEMGISWITVLLLSTSLISVQTLGGLYCFSAFLDEQTA